MKKICFFSANFENSGGTERVTSIIANELVKLGYDITIISCIGGKKSFFKLDEKIKLDNLYDSCSGLKFNLTASYKLRKKLKKYDFDYIIDIDTIHSFFSIPATVGLRTKVISWEHFNFYSDLGIKRRKWGRILASKFADRIITLTNEDREAFLEKLSVKSKIDYIYNPTPYPNEMKNSCESKIAISIGRLTAQKGFDKLLDIWKEIEEKGSDWQLYIIGSGENKEKLLKQKEDLKLKNVVFVENTKNIKEYYEKASIYLMTSRFEGLPMTLIEAQSFGLPIISYDIKTGPKDVINNEEDGYLIENDNKELFIEKFLELSQEREKIKKFSQKAYENSKKFKLDNIVKKWENILK